MKVTLGKKQEKLNEFEPITMIMFVSLILNALQFLFPRLGSILSSAGRNLDSGIKSAEEGIKNAPIPEDKKQDFLQRLETAKKDLQLTLQRFKEKAQDIQRKERPSAVVAQKVLVLVKIITEVRGMKEIAGNKEVSEKLTEAEKLIRDVAKDLANLDLISALSSKEDPNGLWKKVPQLQSSFKEDAKWLDFTASVAKAVTNPKDFHTARMPTGTNESNGLFKLVGDKFILSEGYGSVRSNVELDELRKGDKLQKQGNLQNVAAKDAAYDEIDRKNQLGAYKTQAKTSAKKINRLNAISHGNGQQSQSNAATPAATDNGSSSQTTALARTGSTAITPASRPVKGTAPGAITKVDPRTISVYAPDNDYEIDQGNHVGFEKAISIPSRGGETTGSERLPAPRSSEAPDRSGTVVDAVYKANRSDSKKTGQIIGAIIAWAKNNGVALDAKAVGKLIPSSKDAAAGSHESERA